MGFISVLGLRVYSYLGLIGFIGVLGLRVYGVQGL